MIETIYKVVGINTGKTYFTSKSFDEVATYKTGYEQARAKVGELYVEELITYKLYNSVEMVTIKYEEVYK